MSSLHNVFYKSLPVIKNDIFGSLVSRGFYLHRPDTVRAIYIGAGLLIGFLSVSGGQAIGSSFGMSGLSFIIAGILSGIIICGFGWFMPARTDPAPALSKAFLASRIFSLTSNPTVSIA